MKGPVIDRRRFQAAREIFTDALARPPEARTAFVAEACAGDGELLAEVRDLLDCHAGDDDPADAPLRWPDQAPVPERIGPYRVLGLVGQGGMGVVYRARLAAGGDDAPEIALKVLRPGIVTSHLERRFQREIEVLRRLDHPGIARLLDAGTADGAPYFATEYIEGVTLADWRVGADPSTAERLRLLAELCDAVHVAHVNGVVHRDLKPENILVTPDGHPRVLDFGIARLTDGEAPSATLATRTWQLLGTVRYMSPEQATGGAAAIDARSDVYGLGVVAFELLTGDLPYDLKRMSTPRALLEITTAEPGHVGEPDGALDLIVRHALAKDPDDRYQTAAALAGDLRSHLAGRPVSLRKPGPAARLRRRLRARPQVRRLALGAVIALIAVATTLVLSDVRPSRPKATWAGFHAEVEEGDQLRHSGPPTRENYLAAAAMFTRAREDLSELPPEPYTPDLGRYLKWRLGELYFFIGEHEHDAAMIEQARGCWRDAAETPWTPGTALGIDRRVLYRSRVLRLGSHHPQTGIGMAWASLARLQAPATNFRLAVDRYRIALDALALGAGNYHDIHEPAIDLVDNLAYTLLNRGNALTSLGATIDSLAVVERGLKSLRAADATGGMRDPDGRSLCEEALGAGYLRRAGLLAPAEAAAGLDSARVHLDRARDLRGLGAGRGYWRLYLLRGVLWESRAELATASADSARLVGLALDEVATSRAPLRAGEDDFEQALSDAQEAALSARLAAMARDRRGFAHADSLLVRAQSVLTGNRFPLQFAEVSWRQGQVGRLRWATFGDARDSVEAAAALGRAARAVPGVEWPALQRRLAAETARLRQR